MLETGVSGDHWYSSEMKSMPIEIVLEQNVSSIDFNLCMSKKYNNDTFEGIPCMYPFPPQERRDKGMEEAPPKYI